MAGGKGAKERRRQKRLADGLPHQETEGNQSTNGIKNKGNSKNTKFSKTSGRRNEITPTKKKKRKVSKPKHLKRKLEKAESKETAEEIKEKIHNWESTKGIFSKKHNNESNKRQRTTTDASSNAERKSDGGNTPNQNFKRNIMESIKDNSNKEEMEDIKLADTEIINSESYIKDDRLNTKNEGTETSEEIRKEEINPSGVDSDDYKDNNTSLVNNDDDNKDDEDEDEDDDDEDESEVSEDDNEESVQRRQRGRRRRGRQDTAKKIQEDESMEKLKVVVDTNNENSLDTTTTKKRYCLGRKPVTDFTIGQTCSAEVVYVKNFGVFFDIGCHSDAFCHVSRLSDDFVESPDSLLKEGDKVPMVRIVEIDRKLKRITVSLQSESRIEDERKSINERNQRKESKKFKKKKNSGNSKSKGATGSVEHNSSINRTDIGSQRTITPSSNKFHENVTNNTTLSTNTNIDPSMMTPAELKRARKLARRAERREKSDT